MNKKLHIGDNVRAGEFGHITIEPNGEKCYCGKIGCLDSYVKANLLSDLTNGQLDVFFEELKKGNKKLLKAWNNYLYYLSIAVNNLRMSFDCDIVIGGYIGSYFNEYIEIAKYYSTPRSGQFINGILNSIINYLKDERVIVKE